MKALLCIQNLLDGLMVFLLELIGVWPVHGQKHLRHAIWGQICTRNQLRTNGVPSSTKLHTNVRY